MILHKNPFFKIILKDNYYIYKPNYKEVIILPVINKKFFLLIKAKREILKKSIYEFPAGHVEKNESIITAAKREFAEETGVKVLKKNKFIKMQSIYQIPNRNPNPVNAYYVNISSDQVTYKNFDKDEISKIKIVSLKKIFKMINDGEFKTSVPIALLFQYVIKKKFKL